MGEPTCRETTVRSGAEKMKNRALKTEGHITEMTDDINVQVAKTEWQLLVDLLSNQPKALCVCLQLLSVKGGKSATYILDYNGSY